MESFDGVILLHMPDFGVLQLEFLNGAVVYYSRVSPCRGRSDIHAASPTESVEFCHALPYNGSVVRRDTRVATETRR